MNWRLLTKKQGRGSARPALLYLKKRVLLYSVLVSDSNLVVLKRTDSWCPWFMAHESEMINYEVFVMPFWFYARPGFFVFRKWVFGFFFEASNLFSGSPVLVSDGDWSGFSSEFAASLKISSAPFGIGDFLTFFFWGFVVSLWCIKKGSSSLRGAPNANNGGGGGGSGCIVSIDSYMLGWYKPCGHIKSCNVKQGSGTSIDRHKWASVVDCQDWQNWQKAVDIVEFVEIVRNDFLCLGRCL